MRTFGDATEHGPSSSPRHYVFFSLACHSSSAFIRGTFFLFLVSYLFTGSTATSDDRVLYNSKNRVGLADD